MQYATLGNTGLVVSRLAFGAMTFTSGNQDYASIYKVGAPAANELVSRSLDAGVNFFDTADAYADGQSETLLGQALKSRRNDQGRHAQRHGGDSIRALPSPHPVVGR
jgi:aryl-alcohol dehydrogenase-like predicted oxidoreductase